MIKNLFIIDGAAAGSKKELVKFIEEECMHSKYAKLINKHSTREERKNEKTDLIHVDKPVFEEILKKGNGNFIKYEYEGESYGFNLKDITDAFETYKNLFIIIRNVETVELLRKRLKSIRIILVYIYTDEKVARELLKEIYGNDTKKINKRIKRMKPAWEDFLKQNQLYRKVILNTSDSAHYRILIRKLILHYNQDNHDFIEISETERYLLSKELKGYKDRIMQRIRKTNFEKNVFLMMKYRNTNEHFYTLIKGILKEYGYNCLRADDTNISEKPSNPFAVLYCCKYGIALFDKEEHKNAYSPNVSFELGMMYAQDKDSLILRDSSLPEPPFDIATHLYKNYSTEEEIKDIVKKWLYNISKNE